MIACYKNCIHLEPKFLNAYNRLADTLEQNGQTEEALFYYKKLAQLQRGLADIFLKLEQWSEASRYYQKAINPDFVWSYQNLGEALSKQEKWSEAIIAYRKTIELRSDLPWTHYMDKNYGHRHIGIGTEI